MSDSWGSDSDEAPAPKQQKRKIVVAKRKGVDTGKQSPSKHGNKNEDDVPEEPTEEYAYSRPSMSHVKNKLRRQQLNQEQKRTKMLEKKKAREKRKRLEETLGEKAPPRQKQKTLETLREADETIVSAQDDVVQDDEQTDEFATYFAGKTKPKICITTSYQHTKVTHNFIKELLETVPDSHFYSRRNYQITEIVEYAKNRDFTDLVVINEDNGVPNAWIQVHLPDGPTAVFKLTSVQLRREIPDHGVPTEHKPEMILNNFNTRLGHTIGRMFACLFPQQPEFKGRRVVTFHNQRDFIFFRHHRYIFDSAKKARIQELGPRFTLKLKSLQHGTFDAQFGEFLWLPKKENKPTRRSFNM